MSRQLKPPVAHRHDGGLAGGGHRDFAGGIEAFGGQQGAAEAVNAYVGGTRRNDMQQAAYAPDGNRLCVDRRVGYRRGIADDAVDTDFYIAAHVLQQIGTVAGAGLYGLAAAGRYDRDRPVVIGVEGEVEAEAVPRLDLITAGRRVGGSPFYSGEGDGVVGRRGYFAAGIIILAAIGCVCYLDGGSVKPGDDGIGIAGVASGCREFECYAEQATVFSGAGIICRGGGTLYRIPLAAIPLLPLVFRTLCGIPMASLGRCYVVVGCQGSGALRGDFCLAAGRYPELVRIITGRYLHGSEQAGIIFKDTAVLYFR